jgi:hypothetical protein
LEGRRGDVRLVVIDTGMQQELIRKRILKTWRNTRYQ